MSILTANLKHLYQRKSYLFLTIIFAAIAIVVSSEIVEAASRNKQGGFSTPALWMFFVGSVVVTMPLEVLTKPFTYCLPHHRNIPRQFLFCVGLVMSFLWSLGFLFFPDLSFVSTLLACLSAFSLFTAIYWTGVWFASKCRSWLYILAFLPLILNDNKHLNADLIVVHAIVNSPVLMILLGGIVNVLAWRYWARPCLARRFCGVLWLGTFAAWNKEKMAKYNQARLAEKDKKNPDSAVTSSGLQEFFVSRISTVKHGSLQQHVWVTMYRSLGAMASRTCKDWMISFMVIFLMTCFLCYMPRNISSLIFVMLGLMFARMNLGVNSSLMISGGRRQRFWSALTVAAATSVFVTIIAVVLVLIMHLLEMVIPTLTFDGREFVFTALSIKYLLVPFVMIPFTLAIDLTLHKRKMLPALIVMFIFQFCFAMSVIGELIIINSPVHIGQLHLIICMLFGWLIFIAILQKLCMKSNLTEQTG